MADGDPIPISPRLAIPREEVTLRASRSSGPGGQHVNTSSTRIELTWNISDSPSLSPEQRERLLTRLASRLDSSGTLRLVSQTGRSQLRNKEEAVARFAAIVAQALVVPKTRRPTRPSKAAKRERLDDKRKRGALKKERKRRENE
ncbi:MAG: alternative ribosome rescue aminoacyl-tRNA hydrolase ArfB [Gemmatimonadales bacterium]|nr:alternative ribosome rescue aminoacyl-tRNA hydrolase ArfB [Gemmatimonadales bacterium]MDZ4388364.1 alternative ribosome rescue aminoacyl-tRNA hydrolase ArfB [Gemmatimonadales bacterium]